MIQLKKICAGYHGKNIIKNVSLDFMPGQVLVVLGPNGSGKSTLLKAALGLIETSEGEIFYDGVEIGKLKRKEIARKAGFLTQSRTTPSIQVSRMVLHGRFPYLSYPRHYNKKDYEIARRAMEMTGCLALEDKYVHELSGGERQSVYLAMVLAQETETVFMDEPTTYLDLPHQLQMIKIAKELACNGKAVVLVLHDLALALREADSIAVFCEGELKCCDTPNAICEKGVLEQVFGIKVHAVETPHGKQYYFV